MGFSLITSRPAMNPARFMFTESSDSLGKLGWAVGSMVTYAYQPFDIGSEGVRLGSAVNNLIVQHFYGDLGLADWFTLGFDMPVAWSYKYRDLINDPDASAVRHTAAGDLRLSMKVPILDRSKYGVGLAWENWFTVPTGKQSEFMGSESMSAAGLFILDGSPAPWVTLGLNLGYIVQDHTVIADVLDSDDQFLCQVAAAFEAGQYVGIVTEVSIATETKHFFASKDTTPITARQGIRVNIDDHWRIDVGGEIGLIHGIGAPRAGGFLGFRYVASKAKAPFIKAKAAAPRYPVSAQPAAYTPPQRPAPYVPTPPPPAVVQPPPAPAWQAPEPVETRTPVREQPVWYSPPVESGTYATRGAVITFPAGSSALTQQAQNRLYSAAQAATADKSVKSVRLEGYAANMTGEGDFRSVSTNRALTAAQYFKSCTGRDIEVLYMGLGANYPTGWGLNEDRRVEVIFIHNKR